MIPCRQLVAEEVDNLQEKSLEFRACSFMIRACGDLTFSSDQIPGSPFDTVAWEFVLLIMLFRSREFEEP